MNSQTNAARRPHPATWVLIALLGVIAAGLLIEIALSASMARAQTPPASAGKGTVFAVAGQIDGDTFGLYLVDYENGTICVYQYVPGTRRLRLMAARTYAYDRQLEEYNTEPSPQEIRQLVQ